MDNMLLNDILDRLARHEQAATYGAIAGVVGCNPRSLMARQSKSQRNSWVVSRRTRRPTGYQQSDWHPALARSVEEGGILSTPEALEAWLKSHE